MSKDTKKRPKVVKKRLVDRQGQVTGALIATQQPNVTDRMSIKEMYSEYCDGQDFIIEKGTNVSELMIIHRKTENGMTYFFRAIADNHINNNFEALESEVDESL